MKKWITLNEAACYLLLTMAIELGYVKARGEGDNLEVDNDTLNKWLADWQQKPREQQSSIFRKWAARRGLSKPTVPETADMLLDAETSGKPTPQ